MVGPAFEKTRGTYINITRTSDKGALLVFGLDKAPDQTKGSKHIVDKLLIHGRKMKAAMTRCSSKMKCFSLTKIYRKRGVYSLAQAS